MNRYYAAAARRMGVQPMFVDDAIQEIAIAVWRAPHAPLKQVVRRTAIDCARKYGQRTRHGYQRAFEPIPDSYPVEDYAQRIVNFQTRLAAFKAVWLTATETQRAAFLRLLCGTTKQDYTAHAHAQTLRRRMRKLAA